MPDVELVPVVGGAASHSVDRRTLLVGAAGTVAAAGRSGPARAPGRAVSRAARWSDSSRRMGVPGWLALVMVAVAFGYGAAMALPAAAAEPSVGLGSGTGVVTQAPECVPVPGAECGSVRVPLLR
jgi:hypothetical protein